MKKSLAISALFLICASACLAAETEVYRDMNVVAFEKTWPFYPILGLHTGKSIGLKVAGKTYYKVRGIKPYYVDLPQIHSILFVTEGDSYKVTFHIVDMDTKKSVVIDGDGSSFGWDIGSISADADKAEHVDAQSVVLVKYGGDWKEVTTLNLQTLKVERVQTFESGQRGGVSVDGRHNR